MDPNLRHIGGERPLNSEGMVNVLHPVALWPSNGALGSEINSSTS
jgi:hypothetical protein